MKKGLLVFVTLVIFTGLIGCTTGNNTKKDTPARIPTGEEVIPLSQKYNTLLVYSYETTPVLKKDYPIELKESHAALITALLMSETYSKVAPAKVDEQYSEPDTLLIKIKVADMRIASTSARIWGGAFAGSSYMHMNVQFVEAVSGQLIHEKFFSSTNNAMAAAWTFGSNDRSLPVDLAKIVADYILKKVPAM
ncbi:MAG: hypothetical protein GY702_29180 [Desulfobulbaceae bacterium]|nr:hypothetical protein [Desulfobulbaceae bacterium]